jgi:transcription initiation factor IIE alpha subunit
MAEEYVAYCVKCKTKRTMQDAQVLTNEKGRRMAKGTCPVCGTKMTLFLKSEK